MRCSYRDSAVILECDKAIGINLGADFCAEHEWGIDKLLSAFGCDRKKLGLYGHKIKRDASVSGSVEIDGKTWYYVASERVGKGSYMLKWPTIEDKDTGKLLKTGWDSQGFAVFSDDKKVIDAMVSAFKAKDVTISVGSGGLFKNGGLFLMRYSSLPKDFLKKSEKSDKDYRASEKALKDSQALKKLGKKQDEWRARYPFASDTPFSYIALGVHGDEYWLNPQGQHYIYWGPVSLQDIEDWADEKPGKIINDLAKWEELKFTCSLPIPTYGIKPDGCYRKAFNRVPIEEYLAARDANFKIRVLRKKNPNTGLFELDEKSKRFLAVKLRYMYLDDYFSQIGVYSFAHDSAELKARKFSEYSTDKDIYPRQRLTDEVFGILDMVYLLGAGDFQGSGGRVGTGARLSLSNLSNFREVCQHEAYYDFLDQCGRLPESWRIPEGGVPDDEADEDSGDMEDFEAEALSED